jgi:phosphoribosylaminoimidazole-succinocarboxamide synthase
LPESELALFLAAMDIISCNLPGITKVRSGKVREIFDLGDSLLFVASDRISAFDVVMDDPIPHKGEVLTQISAFWFERFDFVKNHVITTDFAQFPASLQPFADQLRGRSMIVRKAQPLTVECIVRGYLIGSGWKDYQKSGSVCGIQLPPGLRQAEKLPETIFTPSTKADTGHDMNISWEECCKEVGTEIAEKVRDYSIRIYEAGRAYAAERGIILADTKFEFGLLDGEVILIDECLTPDSSRFWPANEYAVSTSPPSFDKQFVRDYLETLDWDKTPPAPRLPQDVIQRTSEKYIEAFERITGKKLG